MWNVSEDNGNKDEEGIGPSWTEVTMVNFKVGKKVQFDFTV